MLLLCAADPANLATGGGGGGGGGGGSGSSPDGQQPDQADGWTLEISVEMRCVSSVYSG